MVYDDYYEELKETEGLELAFQEAKEDSTVLHGVVKTLLLFILQKPPRGGTREDGSLRNLNNLFKDLSSSSKPSLKSIGEIGLNLIPKEPTKKNIKTIRSAPVRI